MRVKGQLNKPTKRSRGAALVLAFCVFQPLLGGCAQAQGFLWPPGFLFNRGPVYRSRVVSNGYAPGLSLSSGTMLNNQSLGLSPFVGQSMALSPMITGQSLSVSPTTLSLSPQTAYYVTTGTNSGSTLALNPQSTFQVTGGMTSGTTLALNPQSSGAQTLSLNGAPTADHGMQVLSLGFGGNQAKVNGFLQTLRNKLAALAGAVGKNLNKQDLANLLLATAKDALAGTGFGFAADPVLDLFLKPLIDKIIGEKFPAGTDTTPPVTPADGDTPTVVTPATTVPSGGMTFSVSGTIVLTPTSGGTGVAGAPAANNGPNVSAPAIIRADGGVAAPKIGDP